MHSTNKFNRILSFILFTGIAQTALSQPQANKPTTANQVQSISSGNVNPVPGAYSSGILLNYIRTREALGPITNESSFASAAYTDVKETTQYFDGLGRPLQSVSRQASPNGNDLVAPVVYDAFGREVYKYLPYVQTTGTSTNDGHFKLNPFADQATFYNNTGLNPGLSGEQVFYGQTDF